MVVEARVLFGIEDFQERRSRISSEVHVHLVDFIQQEDRVHRARLLDHLNDLTRKGADICPAVSPNLGLVPHTTQGEPDEFAAGRSCDRHSERCLADSRRSGEAENGAFGLLDELAHRKELQNSLFDLVEPIVIFIQDPLGGFDISNFPAAFLPRDPNQPVHIVSGDR